MNQVSERTYADCLALAERSWGENWWRYCQIVWTGRARTKYMWVCRAIKPLPICFRRVP